MLNVAIVGLGSVSPIHLIAAEQAAQAGKVELAAVCDIDPTTFQKVAEFTSREPARYTDYDALLRHPGLDAVHLCLPHYLHVPYTERALAAGLHVFLEKPMCLNLAECRDLVAHKKAKPDLHAGICLQNRLNRTTEVLREELQGKTVTGAKLILAWGRPKAYYEVQPWRGTKAEAGSGVLLNQAIHSIDLLQYLVGPVAELSALTGQLLDYGIEVEDSVIARFKFAGGQNAFVTATLANCCNSSVEFEFYTADGTTYQIKDYCLFVSEADGTKELLCRDDLPEGGKIYYGSSHTRLIHKFYNAILGETGDSDYIPLEEALPGMAIVEAILAAEPNTTVHVEQE